jgi:hypothetical protein
MSPGVAEIQTTFFLTRALAPDRGVVNRLSVRRRENDSRYIFFAFASWIVPPIAASQPLSGRADRYSNGFFIKQKGIDSFPGPAISFRS